MDNNNPSQNIPQNAPMGQGMPNQGMPMGQPYQQPMMKPPKQPMDPAKKKKLILGLSIGGVVLALGIAAAIIIPILLKVDYAEAYDIAEKLKSDISKIYYDTNCENVVDYVDSERKSTKDYNTYIENCRGLLGPETNGLISDLGNTAAITRDEEIGKQFEKFKTEYDKLLFGEDLDAKLALWRAWHNFVVAYKDTKDLESLSDAEVTAAYNNIINSGNEKLKAYGERLLEIRLAMGAAYRAYRNSSYSSPDRAALRDNYNKTVSDWNDWVAANKPDLGTIAPLDFGDTSKMNTEYTRLYNMIRDKYEKDNAASNKECITVLGETICN